MTNTLDIPENAVCIPLQMRWVDMDSYAHANNAVYLTYIEEARFRWRDGLVKGVDGTLYEHIPAAAIIVAASHHVEYVQQLNYEAVRGEINVHFWNTKIGNSSFTSATIITDRENQQVFAKASTVLVQFNEKTQRPQALTDTMKGYLSTHMGEAPQFHS